MCTCVDLFDIVLTVVSCVVYELVKDCYNYQRFALCSPCVPWKVSAEFFFVFVFVCVLQTSLMKGLLRILPIFCKVIPCLTFFFSSPSLMLSWFPYLSSMGIFWNEVWCTFRVHSFISAFWIHANLPANLPSNIEVIAHSFILTPIVLHM